MTDLQVNSFDYSLLGKETVEYLQEREISMARTLEKTSEKIGEDLYKAQQKLANYGNGKFEEWFTSLGFKKTNVYDYIKRYKFVRQLNEPDDIKQFQQLPVKLQNEISKPSANMELNQKVFDGDITTHEQYKILEQKLKEKDSQLEQAKRSEQIAIEQLEREQNKEPKVVEKIVEVEKEVVHPHVEDLRSDNKQLSEALKKEQTKSSNLSWELEELTKRNEFIEKNYNSLIEQRADVDEKSEKYDQLTEAIQNAKGDLDSQQKLIADYKAILKVIKQGNELLLKVSGVAYLEISDVVNNNKIVSREFDSLINGLERLVRDLRSMKAHNIIEGEIINE